MTMEEHFETNDLIEETNEKQLNLVNESELEESDHPAEAKETRKEKKNKKSSKKAKKTVAKKKNN